MKKKIIISFLSAAMISNCFQPAAFVFASENSETSDVIYYPDPGIKENLPDQKPSAGEDFFLSVNYDKLMELELPVGYSSYGMINILQDDANQITKELLAGSDFSTKSQEMAALFYNEYQNLDKRNEAGFQSVIPYVEQIEEVKTASEYLDLLQEEPVYRQVYNIIVPSVSPDKKGDDINIVTFHPALLYLEDSAEYADPSELGIIYKQADDTYFMRLLTKYGYDEDTAQQMIDDAYAFECKEAEYILPVEASYEPDYEEQTYNPYTQEGLISLAGDFPMEDFLDSLQIANLDKYVVTEPEWIQHLSELFADENLDGMKAELLISLLDFASYYTDEEAYIITNDWTNEKTGSSGMKDIDELAFDTVNSLLPEVVSDLYVKHSFTEEDRAKAEEIVYSIKDSMKNRLEKVEWMSDETKAIALDKLDSIAVNVGYADSFYYDYSQIEISPENDLFTNVLSILLEESRQCMSFAGKPVNKTCWNIDMPANLVNACYRPEINDICFPAAILKAPIFDASASISSNYGGLGIVAGHELTHAFDTAGSQYDKNGKLVNWWQDADREAFDALTDLVAERYHSYATVDEERVKGDLTIGETVADLGGAAAALDVINHMKEAGEEISYEDFFEANAKFWLSVLTRENALYRLKADPHAPTCLRTNVSLTQFDEFYDTYHVVEGDPMYTAPENRLNVW